MTGQKGEGVANGGGRQTESNSRWIVALLIATSWSCCVWTEGRMDGRTDGRMVGRTDLGE